MKNSLTFSTCLLAILAATLHTPTHAEELPPLPEDMPAITPPTPEFQPPVPGEAPNFEAIKAHLEARKNISPTLPKGKLPMPPKPPFPTSPTLPMVDGQPMPPPPPSLDEIKAHIEQMKAHAAKHHSPTETE